MSEMSETYNLRTADQESGVAILAAAGLRGFVYPPENGWVTLLVDAPMGGVPPSLIAQNTGVLVRYLFAEDFGWEFSIWSGPKRIAHYECGWETGAMAVKDEDLSPTETANFVLPKPDDSEMLHALHEILHPRGDDFQLPRPPSRFLELTGLPNSDWSSYEYLLGDYDEGNPEYADIRHVDATAVVPIQGKHANPQISERLRSALMFPANLRGDDATVRRCWSKIIRKAWKAGTWSEAFAELEFVSVVDDIPLIISSPDSFGRPRGSEYWRPYWIGVLLDQITCKAEKDNERACEKFDRLALEGMNYFWFVLGILEIGEMCFPPKFFMPSVSRTPQERSRAYLEKFLPWLGELSELRPLMWNWLPWTPYDPEGVESPDGWYLEDGRFLENGAGTERVFWAGNLFALCHGSGLVELDAETKGLDMRLLARKHHFDAISMILSLKAVRRDGDEYVLRQPPKDS